MDTNDDMSHADVLTAVRGRLSAMPLADPPDVTTIMARGRARRYRRLVPGVTGTLAVAAGAALAVTALAPASHQAGKQVSHQPDARLAAWTVAQLANGDISITIRELEDPAGLQSTLRADGVPASVTFSGQQNPACQAYPGGSPQALPQPATTLLTQVFPRPYADLPPVPPNPQGMSRVPGNGNPPAPQAQGNTVIVIDPSALPGNAGVQIGTDPAGRAVGLPDVVYASTLCTGG
jgi:hypothetical protein